jgi:predicted RNase H-like HicB family nuclease
MKRLIFKIEKGDEGFWAYSDDLPGVTSYSDTYAGIKDNIREALELYYETAAIPTFSVGLDLKQFAEHYNFFNISALAETLGINASLMRQYAKGIKLPGEKRSYQILQGINALAGKLKSELV